uniref:Uncharacterized protein n=1 Tax=Oryza sativa subsp. japonica TaxID=39947 RepID=Q6YXI4_ORYSJ|nr:hypothetical protein [Oryza sativa Japonica Group]
MSYYVDPHTSVPQYPLYPVYRYPPSTAPSQESTPPPLIATDDFASALVTAGVHVSDVAAVEYSSTLVAMGVHASSLAVTRVHTSALTDTDDLASALAATDATPPPLAAARATPPTSPPGKSMPPTSVTACSGMVLAPTACGRMEEVVQPVADEAEIEVVERDGKKREKRGGWRKKMNLTSGSHM